MREEPTIDILKELQVVTDDTVFLYSRAIKKIGLGIADYLTIRDLSCCLKTPDVGFHAVMICLFWALDEGSLCLNIRPEALSRRLGRFIGSASEEIASKIVRNLQSGVYAEVITDDVNAFFPVIRTDQKLYFQKYYNGEVALQQMIDRFLNRREFTCRPDDLRDICDDVWARKPVLIKDTPIVFNAGQKLALIVSLLKNFSIISGGPGTGKTSIVIAILRGLVRLGIPAPRIRLAAPTGRAAQRITESVRRGLDTVINGFVDADIDASLSDIEATTIHRLLKYNPARNAFVYNRYNRLPVDVLIIDEVSMVDVVLMMRLMESLREDVKVILLGDKNQLPSVEAGAVLADLTPDREPVYSYELKTIVAETDPDIDIPFHFAETPAADRIVILNESYRSEPSILKIAETIQYSGDHPHADIIGRIPVLELSPPVRPDIWPVPRQTDKGWRCKGGGCFRMNPDPMDISIWKSVAASWLHHHYLTPSFGFESSYLDILDELRTFEFHGLDETPEFHEGLEGLFVLIDRARILSLVRKGFFGSRWINRNAISILQSKFDPAAKTPYCHGEPILITRNDYDKDLYNGDVGVVLRSISGVYRAFFARMGRFVSYPVDFLPDYEPAFALTVHKSQGSEYDQVLLVLPDDIEHRLLTREMVYTALTRAKYLVVIYGKKEALLRAAAQKNRRESGIVLN